MTHLLRLLVAAGPGPRFIIRGSCRARCVPDGRSARTELLAERPLRVTIPVAAQRRGELGGALIGKELACGLWRARYLTGSPGMTSKFTELAIDCADPSGLAQFWCSVLDYEVQDEDDGIVTIGPPVVAEGKNHRGPVPPTLTFARVAEGKTVKNRLHLDVSPADRDQDEEVRRLLDLGARHADVGQTGEESWVVLADPEGNEFCVLADRRP